MLVRDIFFRTKYAAFQEHGIIDPAARHFSGSHYSILLPENTTIPAVYTDERRGMRELIQVSVILEKIHVIENGLNQIDGLVFEVAECLGSIGVEAPFLTSRSPSRSLGSGDSQSGSRPDSANPSLVTALSSTAVSNEPNIEPSNDKVYLKLKLQKLK